MDVSALGVCPSKPGDGTVQAFGGPSSAAPDAVTSLATLEPASERSEHYASRSKSQSTINAYGAGWRDFLEFCRLRELVAPARQRADRG